MLRDIEKYINKSIIEYEKEYCKLRDSKNLFFLIKSFGFYCIPFILTYHEIVPPKSFIGFVTLLWAFANMPLLIVSGMNALMGSMWYVVLNQSSQKQLSDYEN